jgi:ATP-binding cassette, subfamily G (WHITE), member 2, PDR
MSDSDNNPAPAGALASDDVPARSFSDRANEMAQHIFEAQESNSKLAAESKIDSHAVHRAKLASDLDKGDAFRMEPSVLTFRNLVYKMGDQVLLKGAVSGFIKPGMMIALIGGPDAGQSTLFDLLAGRNSGGELSGDLLLDGEALPSNFLRHVGLIERQDVHLPTLTVQETLEFSANLRVPSNLPDEVMQARIGYALDILQLRHVKDNIVGNAKIRGISGGEKRRLSIGVEGVAGHSIILADQPTNGLDSSSAYKVCACFREITAVGNGVMCSLVQPSPELFELFDTCMVMSRRSVIYFGPRDEALAHFEGLGYVKPPTKTVADFLETISGDPRIYLESDDVDGKNSTELHSRMLTAYRKSKYYEKVAATIADQIPDSDIEEEEDEEDANIGADSKNDVPLEQVAASMDVDSPPARQDTEVSTPGHHSTAFASSYAGHGPHHGTPQQIHETGAEYATSFLHQVYLCVRRQMYVSYRNHFLTASRLGQTIFVALLIGTLFLDIGTSQADALGRLGALFYILAFTAFGTLAIVPVLFEQKIVYQTQLAAMYFRPLAFQISLFVSEVPLALVESIIFALIVYPLVGFQGGIGSDHFLLFLVLVFALKMTSWSFCLLCAAASPQDIIAQAMAPMCLAGFFVFSGFLIPKTSIPAGWSWMYYGSMFTFPFKALAQNEMVGLQFDPNGSVPGTAFLTQFDLEAGERWEFFWPVWLYMLAFQGCVYIALTYLNIKSIATPVPLRDDKSESLESIAPDTTHFVPQDAKNEEHAVDVSMARATSLMSIHSEHGVWLTFEDLCYTVPVPGGERMLLNKITGYVEPGNMIALMGPSGAGKSTLMDVLAQKKTGGTIEGEILANGAPLDDKFARTAGYVEQSDSHLETQTVFEAVMFSADLRLPEDILADERLQRVNEVLETLGLLGVQHTRIGNPHSGGIAPHLRKKVTIAVELVTAPGLIFLDEPTTGLDAYGAFNVLATVRNMCTRDHVSVVCTIHQPSHELFEMFDTMLLLQKGGSVAYCGPVAKMSDYFQGVGLAGCPPGKNPADYALDVISGAMRHIDEGKDAASLFRVQPERKLIVDRVHSENEELVKKDHVQYDSAFATSMWTQFFVNLERWNKYFWRRQIFNAVRIGAGLFMALIVGSLWFALSETEGGALNRAGFLFMIILYASFFSLLAAPSVIAERPITFRERGSSMYSLLPYYTSRVLAESPYFFLAAFFFSAISYWMTGMQEDGGRFFSYLLMFWWLTSTSAAFTECVAAMCPDADLTNVVATGFLSVFMLFAGFLAPESTIPMGWKWAHYFSYFRPCLFFFIKNEMEGMHFSDSIPNVDLTNGDLVMQRYDIPIGDQKYEYFYQLAIFWFGFRAVTYLLMRFVNHIKR